MADADSLRTLVKLHRNEADIIRREITSLENQVMVLNGVDARLVEELEQERQLAADLTGGLTAFFGSFAQRVKRRREEIAEEVMRLFHEIEAKRELLAEAFRQIKTYEVALEQVLEEERQLQNSRETKWLDEVAIQQFSRNEG